MLLARMLCVLLCALGLSPTGSASASSLESIVAMAQAATVKVYKCGDLEASVPGSVTTKKGTRLITPLPTGYRQPLVSLYPATLVAEYERDRAAGTVAGSTGFAAYAWDRVASAPHRYLDVVPATISSRDIRFASGSGFVVHPDGIVLTNQHVVGDSARVPDWLFVEFALRVVQDLSREFGGEPPKDSLADLVRNLNQWFTAHSNSRFTFRTARVLLPRGYPGALQKEWERFGWSMTGADPIRVVALPAAVLARGQAWPGKDVAVLRLPNVHGLITLPLGDSDAVRVGASVHAFGFPGAAVEALAKGAQSQAEYFVVYNKGDVGQIMPMRAGYSAIHMSADINHGSSGGPVLDDRGEVVGISVAGPTGPEAGQNYAIPINVAKDFLKQAGIQPTAGYATESWHRGLRQYFAGDYRAALRSFEDVERSLRLLEEPAVMVVFRDASPNRYVAEKIAQTRARLGPTGPR